VLSIRVFFVLGLLITAGNHNLFKLGHDDVSMLTCSNVWEVRQISCKELPT